MRIDVLILLAAPALAAEPVALFESPPVAADAIGGAAWALSEGVLTGTAAAGESGVTYAAPEAVDFECTGEVNLVAGAAGLWFRARPLSGRPFGYQLLLAPGAPPRLLVHWGGGEPESLGEPVEAVDTRLPAGTWLPFRVTADGSRLRIEIAGGSITAEDERFIAGRFGLGVGPAAASEVRWRGVRYLDRGAGEGWEALFNGRDLTGWVRHGDERWEVEDGELVGQAVTDRYGYLATERTFEDVEIRIEFRCIADGNSGLFFHSTLNGVDIRGVQAEISPGPHQNTAGLYESGGRGWIARPDEWGDAVYRPREWNTMQVRCRGNRTTTWLNGYRVVDLVDPEHRFTTGVLALQLHSGGNAGVRWRRIEVR